MKVYVAASGEYSDYHIVGIFSSEEKVRQFGYEVFEEYEVDLTDQHPGCKWYELEISLPTGQIDRLYQSDEPLHNDTIVEANRSMWIEDRPEYPREWGRPTYKEDVPRVCSPALRICCWAKDEEHAIKIAGDKRKEYLASHPDLWLRQLT